MKLIVETAWHHEGNFEFLNNLIIQVLTRSNIDYIKLHVTIDLEEYMARDHELYPKLKRMLIKKHEWVEIMELLKKRNVKKILLLNDTKAIDFGISYCPEIVEIHSVCLNDINILDALKQNITSTTKIMLGVGGSTLYEIERAINRIGTNNIILMHGFQNYPTKFSDINFSKIKKIMSLYPCFEHGYADHTEWNNPDNILITLFGASLGMDYIEKHITTEFGESRIDSSAAISIDMLNELIEKLKLLKSCYGNGLLELNDGEKKYSQYGIIKKAAILSKSVKKGDVFAEEHIMFKRINQVSDLSQIEVLDLLGKKFAFNLDKFSVIYKNIFN